MKEYPTTYLKKIAQIPEFKDNPPSLEELIDLCKSIPKFKDVNDLNLLSKMRICISNSCCNSYLNTQTLHDFWLIFYMDSKYQTHWYEGCNYWR